jgi:type I restriction enzyme M protein
VGIQLRSVTKGTTRPRINLSHIRSLKIPLPSIAIQNEIVNQIQEEQKRIQATKELVEIFEQKIKDKIAEIW